MLIVFSRLQITALCSILSFASDILLHGRTAKTDPFILTHLEPRKAIPKPKPVQVEIPAWEDVRPQLAAVLSAGLEEYPPPFDAASDVPIDQQK